MRFFGQNCECVRRWNVHWWKKPNESGNERNVEMRKVFWWNLLLRFGDDPERAHFIRARKRQRKRRRKRPNSSPTEEPARSRARRETNFSHFKISGNNFHWHCHFLLFLNCLFLFGFVCFFFSLLSLRRIKFPFLLCSRMVCYYCRDF